MSQIPDAVQKHLAALAAEAAEKAVASRMSATPVPAPAVTTASTTEKMSGLTSLGIQLQHQYVRKFGESDGRVSSELKSYVQKAGANASTSSTGGALIQPAFDSEVIPVLREKSVLLQAGVRLYTYAGPSLNIGKLNAGVTVGWVAEGGAPTASTIDTGAVVLGNKHAAAYVQASNQMLRTPSFDAASTLADDILSALAAEVDAKFLIGDGTLNTPTGIIPQLAAGQAAAITATPTAATIEKDLVNAMKRVRLSKLQFQGNNPVWIMPSQEYFSLMALRNTGVPVFPELRERGTLYGYPVFVTDATSNQIVFMLANQVAYGMSFGPEVGMGLSGTDLISDCTTVYGRFIGDVKVRYDKCAAAVTGTNVW